MRNSSDREGNILEVSGCWRRTGAGKGVLDGMQRSEEIPHAPDKRSDNIWKAKFVELCLVSLMELRFTGSVYVQIGGSASEPR